MARKHRLEYPGAIYHVINRGNYRAWVFKEEGAKESFQRSLFEACVRFGWVLHAYVIMGNHYHLALETPEGNLSAGMHWLQAGFATRFNRLRKERGHLFQGRFKALVVEAGGSLGQVCHYIHLNPARAGVVEVEALPELRHGSLWYLTRPDRREAFMRFEAALQGAGGLVDTAAGRRSYLQYLSWQMESGPAGRNRAYESMSRGWALGSGEFKRELLLEHRAAGATRVWDAEGTRQVRELLWQEKLDAALAALPARAKRGTHKSAPWKVAVAAHLKATSDVTNGWLAQRLDMGSGVYVSKHVGLARRGQGEGAEWLRHLEAKVKGKT